MNKIPVIINNRDLFTWPKKMVEKLQTLNNVGDVIIVDNDSRYEPLIEWYKTLPCEIVYTQKNLGHIGAWASGTVNKLNSKFYVVSDPDLGIDNLPNNTLEYLLENLQKHNLFKIGLGLEWEQTPTNSPYYNHIMSYEKPRWDNSRNVDGVHLDIQIDTTFALYAKDSYFIGGASTGKPYVAKHYPWYMTEEQRNNNDEFKFYLSRANSSCSYKTFLKL